MIASQRPRPRRRFAVQRKQADGVGHIHLGRFARCAQISQQFHLQIFISLRQGDAPLRREFRIDLAGAIGAAGHDPGGVGSGADVRCFHQMRQKIGAPVPAARIVALFAQLGREPDGAFLAPGPRCARLRRGA